MNDLIEALQIFAKYTDATWPSWCEHDMFHICVEPEKVSEEDTKRLDELGFFPDESGYDFRSYRFGSC